MTVYDAKTGEKITKRHRFTSLRIAKGSAVDHPAQEPAKTVLLMKRRDGESGLPAAEARKGYVSDQPALTTSVNGHTHIVDLASISGYTSWESTGEGGHSHPYVVTEGGSVVIGETAGHTHQIDVQAAKAARSEPTGEPMSSTTPAGSQPATDQTKRIAELEKSLAHQTALASLNDAQRTHFATLKGADAEAFLAAEPVQRASIVEAAKAADAVVYKAKDGTEYRRSDDPRLVAMAKREDEREALLAKERDERATLVLKARAQAELGHMPGEEGTKVALLKAVDGIADEALRAKVLESIRATDAGLSAAFKRAGVKGEPAGGTPDAQLEGLARKRASEKGISFERAYAQVAREPEGAALLAQTMGEALPAGA